MAGHWRACVASGALLAASLCAPAWAQAQGPGGDDAREQAREAFAEGITLAEERRWEEAAARFRTAMALHDAPAIRYNLASALFEMGELTEAWRLLAPVRADPETPPELSAHAQTLETQIRDLTGIVTVRVTGDATTVSVAMDGEPLASAELGRALAVEPGEHTFTATRDGAEVARRDVRIARRESVDVDLAVAPSPASASLSPLSEEEPGSDGEATLLTDFRLWAIVGGVVVVAAVILIAVAASGTEDPVQGDFEPGVITW